MDALSAKLRPRKTYFRISSSATKYNPEPIQEIDQSMEAPVVMHQWLYVDLCCWHSL